MAIEQIDTLAKEDMVQYAVLDIDVEDAALSGVEFKEAIPDGTWDDADRISEALVRLPSGTELLLIDHLDAPDFGIDVRASIDIDDPAVAHELVRELGLPPTKIKWIRPEGDHWPSRG